MAEKSEQGAASGSQQPQEGADDKDEKKELDGTGAGSTMGGTTGGEAATSTSGKKDKGGKKKKGKKKKTAHFKKRGHPCYKVLCIVFSLLSLASLCAAIAIGAMILTSSST